MIHELIISGITRTASDWCRRKVMGSMLGPNCVIAKDVKICKTTATISDTEHLGMPWPKTGATQYHAQLGLVDKGRAKGW